MRLLWISWRRSAALVLLLALIIPVLAACGGTPAGGTQPTAAAPATAAPQPTAAAEPTAAPQPTAAAEPTAAPTAEAAAPTAASAASNGGLTENNGLLVAAALSCDEPYTGLIKEIAAVDPTTVRFTMCAPDPAFPSKAAFTSFAIQPSEYIEFDRRHRRDPGEADRHRPVYGRYLGARR